MRSVLVIDDDKSLLNIFKQEFENEVNLEMCLASSFLEGLAIVARRTFDLYIIDINLDGQSGIDIIGVLQKEKNIDNRIVIITAKKDEQILIDGYNFGASNIITKPINFKILKAILKKNIRMIENKESGHITIGNILLQPEMQRCLLRSEEGDQEIHFTNIEFKILYSFCKNPNVIKSKDDLSFLGKDSSEPMSYKALEMHISSIKKKLGQNLQIKTRRGVGYFVESSISQTPTRE